jgi:hypothetical protein
MTAARKSQESAAPRLWELSDEIAELERTLADILDAEDLSEGEKEARAGCAVQEWLAAGEDFDRKAERVAEYIKHLEALAAARQGEYRRLRDLYEQAQNQADSLRRYLAREMCRTNRTRIEGVKVRLSLRRKQPKVLLHCDPEQLPAKFVRVTPVMGEIRTALKADPDLGWASLSTVPEYSLYIR